MKTIEFREILTRFDIDDFVFPIWRECTPRILVVTDGGLNYSSSSGFGLSQFIDTLASSTIHGMTPQIVTASRSNALDADIQNYDFTHPTDGLLKSRYDVVFLFGIASGGSSQLPQDQVDAIARFMQAGGGVFATGDHEALGAAISRDIPRIRNMRYWESSETPDANDATRLSTNPPGDDGIYEFVDQSDVYPQRLYVNYRTQVGGIGNPHPLLQGGSLGAIEVFPDHPHEGECRIPSNLETTFTLDGQTLDEWPRATGGGLVTPGGAGPISPEMVALTMSHGNSFPGKDALTPRSFMAIVAYNGHPADVGRAVTDATWHHFVNINIDGTGSSRSGLQSPPGTDTPDLLRIRQYFRNLATWLMPENVRRCLRFPFILRELIQYPLFEELRIPPLNVASGKELHDIGQQVFAALALRFPAWQADELVSDALTDAVGETLAAKLLTFDKCYGRFSGHELGLAALGALTVGTIEAIAQISDPKKVDHHQVFTPIGEKATKLGVIRYVEEARKELQELDSFLCKIGQ